MKPPGGARRSSVRRQMARQQDLARRGWARQQRDAQQMISTAQKGYAAQRKKASHEAPREPPGMSGAEPSRGRRWPLYLAAMFLVLGLGGAAAFIRADPDVVVVSESSPEQVKEIQSALNDRWGKALLVDGQYGQRTRSAVQEFQTSKSLEPTGTVDGRTYKLLLNKSELDLLLSKRALVLSTNTRHAVGGVAVACMLLAALLILFWIVMRRVGRPRTRRALVGLPPERHLAIFISYRHADTPAHTIVPHISESLREALKGDNVFLDERSIAWGDPIDEAIRARLRDIDVLLAIIGSRWEPERLRDEHDWVREELQTIHDRGKRIIPVLAGDDAPSLATLKEILPDDLRWLVDRKAFHIGAFPEDDIRRLTVYFQHEVTHSLRPLTPNGILGVARHAQVSAEPNRWIFGQQDLVLTLRLETRHAPGPVPFELRGGDVLEGGAIEDDDIVEVPRRRKNGPGRATRVPFMLNRTTRTTVRVTTSPSRKVQNGVQVALAVLLVGALIVAAVAALT